MIWSRYNCLYRSARDGFFLYNALSNTLLKLDEEHYRAAESLRDGSAERLRDDGAETSHGAEGPSCGGPCGHEAAGDGSAAAPGEAFLAALRAHAVLVEPAEERRRLLALRYARLARHFETGTLGLTICPTLACNFRCPYCFEHSQAENGVMSSETVERLLGFIAGFTDARRLAVAWYGGEPTLAWEAVRALTARFRDLDIVYENAGLVTNGYLLDAEKSAQLNELSISSVQITLDGPAELHDQRRRLAAGGPTYARIMENIAALLASDYTGKCVIRVNVDSANRESFGELRGALLERFHDPRLSVYAGRVHADPDHPYGPDSCLAADAWAEYTLSLYGESGLLPTRGFYPSPAVGGCVANAHQGFVVGPAGELYKCWEDVGLPALAIGNVHADEPVTAPGLRAHYALGTDPDEEPACRACHVLPICTGGCPNKRLRTLQFGESGHEYCSPYKDHLVEYLEAYYDTYLTREICAAVLGTGTREGDDCGWRVVSPGPQAQRQPDPLAGPIGGDD